MSGVIVRVLPKTSVGFSDVAANGSYSQVVARQIDVSQWRDIVAAVRVFDLTITQNGATIDVEIYNDGRTAEEPGAILWQTTACATISLNNQNAGANAFPLAALDDYPVGGALLVVVTGNQGAVQDTVSATLSIELVLKT